MTAIRTMLASGSDETLNLLLNVVRSDPQLEVVACVKEANRVVEELTRVAPDIVVMDVELRDANGFALTRRIMAIRPTPVLLVSDGQTCTRPETEIEAINAGALSLMPLPDASARWPSADCAASFIERVKLFSEVKVVTRRGVSACPDPRPADHEEKGKKDETGISVVVVGSSTGGPVALQSLLGHVPLTLPVPIVIVQHISPGFIEGLAQWIGDSTAFPSSVANDGEIMKPGHVYLAPDLRHLQIDQHGRFLLSDADPVAGLRPAVSVLFRSACRAYGSRCIGVLLSGMGCDGANELLELRNAGAMTFAQSEESCVVPGMPGEAIRIGAARKIQRPEHIGEALGMLWG